MIKMVNQVKIHACFVDVQSLLGESLQQSETHLMPSIEVSQMVNLKILFDMHISPERHT